MARCSGLAERPRLRLDPRLPASDGRPGPRGDRAAAAPQPRCHVLGRAGPTEAGRAEHGHDARDDEHPTVHLPRRGALRESGQGSRGADPGPRGGGTPGDPVHNRHPGRDRRDRGGARRLAVRDPPGGSRLRAHPRSHRAELPREAGHRDARSPGRGPRRLSRHSRRRAADPRTEDAHPGAPQPLGSGGPQLPCWPPASTTGAVSARSRPTTSIPSAPGPSSTTWRVGAPTPASS